MGSSFVAPYTELLNSGKCHFPEVLPLARVGVTLAYFPLAQSMPTLLYISSYLPGEHNVHTVAPKPLIESTGQDVHGSFEVMFLK
jgi:hypothetical protein